LLMRNKIVASHFIFLLIFIFAITAVAGGRKPDAVKESGCSFVVLKNADFFPALLKAIDEARSQDGRNVSKVYLADSLTIVA